jgi:hypothetical protein
MTFVAESADVINESLMGRLVAQMLLVIVEGPWIVARLRFNNGKHFGLQIHIWQLLALFIAIETAIL